MRSCPPVCVTVWRSTAGPVSLYLTSDDDIHIIMTQTKKGLRTSTRSKPVESSTASADARKRQSTKTAAAKKTTVIAEREKGEVDSAMPGRDLR